MRMIAMMLAALVALCSISTPATAQEGRGQPFITAAHYKANITIEEFRANPRSYFRSEAAFDLIVDYVGDEIGVDNLTDAQFIALVRDGSRTRVRDCAAGERINTGALAGSQFHWFVRGCRSGEQIVETLVNGVWIDLFSLGCLNAVEDSDPVAPPSGGTIVITLTPPSGGSIVPPAITTSVVPGASVDGQQPFFGYYPSPSYAGGNMNINAGSSARSSSSATATTTGGGCPAACTPTPPRGH